MALTFGGATSDRVQIAAAASINSLDTKTIYGWFYPTTITADRRLFTKMTSGFNGWDLAIQDSSGNLNWYVNRAGGNSHQTSSSSPLTTNKWWFVAGTYDVGAAQPTRLYIGDLSTAAIEPSYSSTTTGSGATSSDTTEVARIGNLYSNANAFQGRIGLVGMLNRALTLQEIIDLQFKPRVVNGTVLFMPLGYNSNSTPQPDLSGNANSGTVTGASLTQEGLPLRTLFGFGDDVQTPMAAVVSCATGGTITASINEGDIVTGGKVLTLTLTNDTWVDPGSFDAQRQPIINGIDSNFAEATGWDAVVKATLAVTAVVRTSPTVVTITLPAFATFNITATETITPTVPSTALTGGNALVASPAFTVAVNVALVAGTASFVSKTATTMSVSASAPTGGTAPYTYQWERRVGNTGGYSNVSGATSLTLTDTGLTSGELYEYRCKQTDNVSATVTTNSTVLTRTWIDPNNQAIFFSPYNTDSDGAGALAGNNVKASSTFARWTNAGAYLKFKVTIAGGGAGDVKLMLDTSSLSGLTANTCPLLLWFVDGGQANAETAQVNQPAYSASIVTLTLRTGLAVGTHLIEVFLRAVGSSTAGDRWTTPTKALTIKGIDIDTGATMVAPTLRPNRMIVYGASHDEGIDALGTGGAGTQYQDATHSVSLLLAFALNAEYGIVAYSGQGFVKGIDRVTASTIQPALKNADPAKESWDKYANGRSRLVSGLYSPVPTYVLINTATNDYQVPLAGADVTPALDAIRTAAGVNAWIFVNDDIAGSQSAALTAGVAAAAVQTRLRHIIGTPLVDASNGFVSDRQSVYAWDSTTGGSHPNVRGNAKHAAEVIALIQAQLSAVAAAGGLSRIQGGM